MTLRQQIDEFAAALDAPDAARALDDELRALLAVAHAFEVAPVAAPAPFRDQLRRSLVDAAGATRSPAPLARVAEWLTSWRGRRTTIAVAASTAIVVVFAALAFATVRSVPGDPLYGAKRATESLRLDLAHGDAARARVQMQLARARLGELRVLASRGSPERAVALLDDMDAETRAAVALSHSDADWAELRAFAELQYAELAALVPHLDPVVAARASTSLQLLDAIRRSDPVAYSVAPGGSLPGLPRGSWLPGGPGLPGVPLPGGSGGATGGAAAAQPGAAGGGTSAGVGLPGNGSVVSSPAPPLGPAPPPTDVSAEATTIPSVRPLPTDGSAPLPTDGSVPLATVGPTALPTAGTTPLPTSGATALPTLSPAPLPTPGAAPLPTLSPAPLPTLSPTPVPTVSSSRLPTVSPTPLPTVSSSRLPTVSPTPLPTVSPTPLPSVPTVTSVPLPTSPLPTVTLSTPALSATSVLSTSLPPLP